MIDMSFKTEQEHKGIDIKTDFLYGLVVILPIVVTVWLIKVTIQLFSGPIYYVLGQKIPLLISLLITLVLITAIGLLARNIIGKMLINYFEKVMGKIPIVNIVYKSIKQVIGSFSFNKKNFLGAVLIEYPRKGTYALGFVTKEVVKGVKDKDGKNLVEGMSAVFVPTTPNPTSGYFLYAKQSELTPLDISVEDSVKILMSAGVLEPGQDLS